MPTKKTYTNIFNNIQTICSNGRGLSSEAKTIINEAVDIIKKTITEEKKNPSENLKKECDSIFVGALISAMAQSDKEPDKELTDQALSDTDSELSDFLYPVDSSIVHQTNIGNPSNSLILKKFNLQIIGRRALTDKTLPFTGSFNPACFPDLDKLFEPEYFDEYELNTNPSTMIHPLTEEKNKLKIVFSQQRLEKELDDLVSGLIAQLESASERSNNDNSKNALLSLLEKVLACVDVLECKLDQGLATDEDINNFKNAFKQVIAEHKTIINEHRGLFMVRGIMDALAEIERWMRQFPTSIYGRPFSLAHKDTFFSTKTARVAEDTCNKIDQMFSPG